MLNGKKQNKREGYEEEEVGDEGWKENEQTVFCLVPPD